MCTGISTSRFVNKIKWNIECLYGTVHSFFHEILQRGISGLKIKMFVWTKCLFSEFPLFIHVLINMPFLSWINLTILALLWPQSRVIRIIRVIRKFEQCFDKNYGGLWLLLDRVLHVINWVVKFQVYIIYSFGFIGTVQWIRGLIWQNVKLWKYITSVLFFKFTWNFHQASLIKESLHACIFVDVQVGKGVARNTVKNKLLDNWDQFKKSNFHSHSTTV